MGAWTLSVDRAARSKARCAPGPGLQRLQLCILLHAEVSARSSSCKPADSVRNTVFDSACLLCARASTAQNPSEKPSLKPRHKPGQDAAAAPPQLIQDLRHSADRTAPKDGNCLVGKLLFLFAREKNPTCQCSSMLLAHAECGHLPLKDRKPTLQAGLHAGLVRLAGQAKGLVQVKLPQQGCIPNSLRPTGMKAPMPSIPKPSQAPSKQRLSCETRSPRQAPLQLRVQLRSCKELDKRLADSDAMIRRNLTAVARCTHFALLRPNARREARAQPCRRMQLLLLFAMYRRGSSGIRLVGETGSFCQRVGSLYCGHVLQLSRPTQENFG